MSRVTSCRLPRVFKLPFARFFLFLSLPLSLSFPLSLLFSGPLRPPATSLPMYPRSAVPYSAFHELVLFPLREISTYSTRAGRQVSSIPSSLRSRDILHHRRCHRVLMLSYMIFFTLPLTEASGFSSFAPFFVLFLRRARECNLDRKTCILRN